uniref:CRM domain-containing protein n=1 Tax=Rhizophora mucronata TaxID=61149 RepID=A0A2P2KPV9_RHIMU
MALSLHSSTSCAFSSLLQSQNHRRPPYANFKAFKSTAYYGCCSGRTIHVSYTKTKRKPRPSFLELIRDKWSRKITSTRERFPWQEEQEEGPGMIETQQASGVLSLPEPEMNFASPSASDSFSSVLPHQSVSAPWIHRTRPRRPHLDSRHKNGVCFRGSFEDREDKAVDVEDSCGKRVKEKEVEFDDISFQFERDKQLAELEDMELRGDKVLFEKTEVCSDGDIGSIQLPWEGERRTATVEFEGGEKRKVSNTELAERTLPEHELRRLRNVALRMLERIKVGAAGITQDLANAIHEKWRLDEVVKLKFEKPLACNMKRTHEMLESRTGGLVIWRSGSSVALYRGMTYKFQCIQSYTRQSEEDIDGLPRMERVIDDGMGDLGEKPWVRKTEPVIPNAEKYLKDLSGEELMDYSELNYLLDELGPRFKDWCGREPLPVDADLLPPIVPEYKPPFRLLPYGVRHCLRDKEMTIFRRLARRTPPHFALGRSRDLQGLAKAIVKLWESSAIAKIAIKRGVQNTRNEWMAEELKRLTGGTLLSRNKEYILFYRGNDFLPPGVMKTLKERQEATYLQQHEEEQARNMATAVIESKAKTTKGSMVAGTLAETKAANSRWGNQPSSEEVEELMRDSALSRRASLIKQLQNKLALAKGKITKAEKSLAKVQDHLQPTELPTDLETLSVEERFLFRKIGLSMKPYLLLGRRGVYSGTIENIHLHWKYRELVKVIVNSKNFAQVKHIAVNLESESSGVLVSVDRTTKGYVIVIYRGKNYRRPSKVRPGNLLTRRQALARSIELQRREGLKYHVSDLQERIELLKSELV